MQRISEVMTRDVRFLSPRESLQRAAQMMDELNVGAIPVCEDERLVGMITDRDITVRATAAGKPPQSHIEDAMSGDVRWCFEDQSIDDVMRQMADSQIRRVPVVSHDEQHRLVGIVALGDLATKTDAGRDRVEGVVEKVSSPSEPDRSTTGRSGTSQANGRANPAGSRNAGGGSPAAGAGATGGTGLGSAASASDLREPASAGVGGEGGTPRAATGTAGAGGAAGAGGIGGQGSLDDARLASRSAENNEAAGAPRAGGTAAVVGQNGGTDATAGASKAGTAGSVEHARNTAAPGGIDAAGTSGPSGGTAGGTAGRGTKASGTGKV